MVRRLPMTSRMYPSCSGRQRDVAWVATIRLRLMATAQSIPPVLSKGCFSFFGKNGVAGSAMVGVFRPNKYTAMATGKVIKKIYRQ